MDIAGSPMEMAAIVAALGWPLLAGLALVVWTKLRAGAQQRQQAALDAELKGMFRSIETRPAPERLTMVVDALEEGEAMKPSTDPQTAGPKSPLTAA